MPKDSLINVIPAQINVIPAQAGIYNFLKFMHSRLRGSDGRAIIQSFPRIISIVIRTAALLIVAGLWSVGHAQPVDSGFLHDYSELKPAAKLPDVWSYEKPGLQREKYTAVILPQTEIQISPDSPIKGFNPMQLTAITAELHKELVQVMGKNRTITEKPGPGTVVINTAITGVVLKKKKRGLLGYTPIGAVIRGVRTLAGENISILDAQLELSFVDSETGEVLGAIVGLPDAKAAGKEDTSWEDIENTIARWGDAVEQRLNK